MAKKFYKCAKCGNIISKYVDSGVPVVCCGEPMMELVANSTDAAGEKHVPVVEVNGNKVIVKVGEVAHPMTEAHLISWIWRPTSAVTREFSPTPMSPRLSLYWLTAKRLCVPMSTATSTACGALKSSN